MPCRPGTNEREAKLRNCYITTTTTTTPKPVPEEAIDRARLVHTNGTLITNRTLIAELLTRGARMVRVVTNPKLVLFPSEFKTNLQGGGMFKGPAWSPYHQPGNKEEDTYYFMGRAQATHLAEWYPPGEAALKYAQVGADRSTAKVGVMLYPWRAHQGYVQEFWMRKGGVQVQQDGPLGP